MAAATHHHYIARKRSHRGGNVSGEWAAHAGIRVVVAPDGSVCRVPSGSWTPTFMVQSKSRQLFRQRSHPGTPPIARPCAWMRRTCRFGRAIQLLARVFPQLVGSYDGAAGLPLLPQPETCSVSPPRARRPLCRMTRRSRDTAEQWLPGYLNGVGC